MRREAGFTLIEVLISLFIFAIISVGTMGAMMSTMDAKSGLDDRMAEIAQLQSARAIMKSDFDRIILYPRRDELGSFQPTLIDTDGSNLISFTRSGRSNPGGLARRGDLVPVAYVFENSQLVRRSGDHLNPGPNAKMRRRVVMDKLKNVELSVLYWENGTLVEFDDWRVAPNGTARQPGALKLRITDARKRVTEHLFELSL